VLVLVVVAIVGYLIGAHRPSASSPVGSAPPLGQESQTASGSNVALTYPSSWKPVTAVLKIPGLAVAHPLLLAPGGDPSQAGLLSGQLPSGGSSPLPASFVTLVHGVPRAEVVTLENVQAYRYKGLNGYHRILDVYVIPTAGANVTALICYAASESSSDLRECGQIVASVTLVGQTSYDLTPDASYASQLGGAIAVLDRERVKLRQEIHVRATLAAVAPLATALADRFSNAAAAVSSLEPPIVASATQAALGNALVAARDAYTMLAAAAGTEEPEAYAAAKRQVEAAEAGVDTALESFALLGYNHAG
jgi:hypothetical protein